MVNCMVREIYLSKAVVFLKRTNKSAKQTKAVKNNTSLFLLFLLSFVLLQWLNNDSLNTHYGLRVSLPGCWGNRGAEHRQDSDLMRLDLEKWAEAVVMLSKNTHK